jgi:amino acid permease
VVLGILFLALALYYWIVPADLLPHFMPGYDAALNTAHFKHGLGAFILAAAAFIFAWFKSGAKDGKALPKED